MILVHQPVGIPSSSTVAVRPLSASPEVFDLKAGINGGTVFAVVVVSVLGVVTIKGVLVVETGI